METIGTVLMIGVFLYPVYWLYDTATSGGTSDGKVFSLIMAIAIGGGGLLFFLAFIA